MAKTTSIGLDHSGLWLYSPFTFHSPLYLGIWFQDCMVGVFHVCLCLFVCVPKHHVCRLMSGMATYHNLPQSHVCRTQFPWNTRHSNRNSLILLADILIWLAIEPQAVERYTLVNYGTPITLSWLANQFTWKSILPEEFSEICPHTVQFQWILFQIDIRRAARESLMRIFNKTA